MDDHDKSIVKGQLKKYNFWLKDLLNDFSYSPKQVDVLEKYELRIQKSEEDSYTRYYNTPLRIRRKKYEVKFDFCFLFKKVEVNTPAWYLVRFLKIKDLFALCRTCKELSLLFDLDGIWRLMVERDFKFTMTPDEKNKLECPKEFHKFYMISRKIGLPYHIGTFMAHSTSATVELARTMADFAIIKDDTLKRLLISVRMDHPITSDLKVSWSKPKNEVFLWSAGFYLSGLNTFTMIPVSKVLRSYKFPKEIYLVQRTFFLNNQYLAIEIKGNIQQSQEKNKEAGSPVYFILYNLEKEVRYGLFGDNYEPPIEISFHNQAKKLDVDPCKEKGETNQSEFTILYDLDEVPEKTGMFSLKICNNSELLCFVKGVQKTFVLLLDLVKKEKIFETYIELKNPLYDLFYTKKSLEDQNGGLFVIDYHSNVYHLSDLNHLKIEQINPQDTPKEEKEIIQKNKTSSMSRFPDSARKYYYGVYEHQSQSEEEKKPIKIKYLVVQKTTFFYFIELSSLKVHRFDLSENEYYSTQIIFDWTIFEDKMFIVSDGIIDIWKFTLPEFNINQLVFPIQTQWQKKSYQQWIQVDPCFTVIVTSKDNSYIRNYHYLEVKVGSTQELIAAGTTAKLTQLFYSFDLDHFLLKPKPGGESVIFNPENVTIKFEKEKLLMRASQHSFFFDMGLSISVRKQLITRFASVRSADFKSASLLEDDFSTKTIEPTRLYKIPKCVPNLNKVRGMKKRRVPKDCKKKDADKERRQEYMIIRGKGWKYCKNIHQNERLLKIQQVENINQTEDSGCLSDLEIEEELYYTT